MAILMLCIGVATALAIFLRLYVNWVQKYWARKNLPSIETNSMFGNMENPLKMKHGLSIDVKNVYDELKRRGHKHGGFFLYTQPAYIPVDPEMVKRIMAKDFQHFVSHGTFYDEKNEPLSAHLFNMDGDKWRNMRIKLTPTFTSGKMKMMFGTLLDCGGPMIEHIDQSIKNQTPLDIKEILACYTTDIIGSCAFGLECNSFKDPNAQFRKYGRQIFEPSFRSSLRMFPGLRKLLLLRSTPLDLQSFFISVIKNIMDYRKLNDIKRNDFVQLFLELNEKAKTNGQEPLTLNEISAQAFVFFIAGFETSSTTMTFCLHELAFNQGIQDKLREEIRETKKQHGGTLTYDGIMEMKYMDQVVNETLRKYPPGAVLSRVCTMDYKVPDTDVVIDKGTKVLISVLGLHRDEEYYPDSEKFDPGRFTEENKAKRPAFSFIPFGEGPRLCIGLRFGLMQTKTGLSMLLDNYRILPGKEETYNMEFDPKSIILTKKGRVTLNAQKMSK